MRKNYTFTMDVGIVEEAKTVAGLVPFSRYIEDLIKKDIQRRQQTGCINHEHGHSVVASICRQ